jgi:hypothetical protein
MTSSVRNASHFIHIHTYVRLDCLCPTAQCSPLHRHRSDGRQTGLCRDCCSCTGRIPPRLRTSEAAHPCIFVSPRVGRARMEEWRPGKRRQPRGGGQKGMESSSLSSFVPVFSRARLAAVATAVHPSGCAGSNGRAAQHGRGCRPGGRTCGEMQRQRRMRRQPAPSPPCVFSPVVSCCLCVNGHARSKWNGGQRTLATTHYLPHNSSGQT